MLRFLSALVIIGLRLQVAATDGPVDTMDLLVSAESSSTSYIYTYMVTVVFLSMYVYMVARRNTLYH